MQYNPNNDTRIHVVMSVKVPVTNDGRFHRDREIITEATVSGSYATLNQLLQVALSHVESAATVFRDQCKRLQKEIQPCEQP